MMISDKIIRISDTDYQDVRHRLSGYQIQNMMISDIGYQDVIYRLSGCQIQNMMISDKIIRMSDTD